MKLTETSRTRAGFHKAGRHFSRSRRPFSIGPLRDPYNRANVTFGVLLVTCGSGYFLSADAIEEKRHGRSARLRRTHDLLRNRYGSSPTIIGEVDEEFVNGERSSETRLPQVFSHGFPSPFTSAFVGNNLVLSLRNVDEGRWWTLIAHTFEHGSWTHLFANFTGIWSMRQYVAIYGIRPFAALWIGGGLAGGLTGLWAEGQKPQVKRGHRDGWMMGASASVLALVTTCSFLNPKSRVMIGLVSLSKRNMLSHSREIC